MSHHFCSANSFLLWDASGSRPRGVHIACPHRTVGVAPRADHVSCHFFSPSDALPCSAWGPNDSYLVLSTLFPLLGRWGSVVLSRWNGGGATKAELYAWSTVSMVVAPGWASLAFLVKMEKVSPGDPRVTWVPGGSDEQSADNAASASCLALWDRNPPIFWVQIVLPIWNGVFFPMFLLTKVSYPDRFIFSRIMWDC